METATGNSAYNLKTRNATKLKESAGSKKKSGFWNCCSGGSTGTGYPSKLKFVVLHTIIQ